MTLTNALRMSWRAKGVPYGGTGQIRQEDGDANYGFKDIKGRPEGLAEIPELERDDALRDLVAAINRPETAFFTIGCVSASVDEGQGHRVSGYVEFAFDSDLAVTGAESYFPVFFHFDRWLNEAGYDEDVHFLWELAPATFLTSGASGFTASIFINTGFHPTPEAARATWQDALGLLAEFLPVPPRAEGRPLAGLAEGATSSR